MTLKEKISDFFVITGMPKTKFCQKVNLTTQSLNSWLHGTLNLSKDTLGRIENYLSKFDSILEND